MVVNSARHAGVEASVIRLCVNPSMTAGTSCHLILNALGSSSLIPDQGGGGGGMEIVILNQS